MSERAVVWISPVELNHVTGPGELFKVVQAERERLSLNRVPLVLDFRGVRIDHPHAVNFNSTCRALRIRGVSSIVVVTDGFGQWVRFAVDVPMTFGILVVNAASDVAWRDRVSAFVGVGGWLI